MTINNEQKGQATPTAAGSQSANTGAGVQQATNELFAEARALREGTAKDLQELKQIRSELSDLRARELLGGVTNAGQGSVKQPDVTPQEYAKMALEGKFNKQK